MKILRWWHDNRKLENNRLLRYWNIFAWIILWIEVNLFTKKKNRETRHDLAMGNVSYHKMKVLWKE